MLYKDMSAGGGRISLVRGNVTFKINDVTLQKLYQDAYNIYLHVVTSGDSRLSKR